MTLSKILMPPTLKPISGLRCYSGDDGYYEIEVATYMLITNMKPGDEKTAPSLSTAKIVTNTGVLEKD